LLAAPLHAETTLLGIAEKAADERALREALEKQAEWLRAKNVSPQIAVGAGDPVRQIVDQTAKTKYDLVVIGARKTSSTGPHWRSEKTYEVIKSISPPVLVAMGEWAQLKRFLICTGGKEFIEEAVQLSGKLASAVGASVTLLHVMAKRTSLVCSNRIQNSESICAPKNRISKNSACRRKCMSAMESWSIRFSPKCAKAVTI